MMVIATGEAAAHHVSGGTSLLALVGAIAFTLLFIRWSKRSADRRIARRVAQGQQMSPASSNAQLTGDGFAHAGAGELLSPDEARRTRRA